MHFDVVLSVAAEKDPGKRDLSHLYLNGFNCKGLNLQLRTV